MANHAHNQRAQFHGRADRPIGVITRGTTNQNRLRRCDRWLRYNPEFTRLLHSISQPLAIDVGYGASHTTTVEWARWLREVRSDIAVRGLEIDPTRVLDPIDGVEFGLGGFELAGFQPHVVRAFNVLRQYDVSQVYAAWETVLGNMDPRGWFLEGTCDELGRQMSWILLDTNGPRSLQLCWDPFHTPSPSFVAQRLPKVLIHRNVPGEGIYELLREADAAWERCAAFAPFGPRIRWREALRLLANSGIPLEIHRSRRDNILSVPWEVVA